MQTLSNEWVYAFEITPGDQVWLADMVATVKSVTRNGNGFEFELMRITPGGMQMGCTVYVEYGEVIPVLCFA
ncbi:hypothetical protein AU152_gp80 [Mycobacterium phage Phlei]|uniref:Uncharacterized protein n=1 Tax=Mycobacterium phage Phlei TaxID=1690684 RepID=A0A0N7E4K1_9CAUD|nr:hypothetical protein AU152_gp80 [Mycobacterium phage Phlei]ALA48193.1 hypothetical protein [Mycobacterium phage Phlei]